MIKYRLGCSSGHEFDSWFRSSEDYERQSRSLAIACPLCGSAKVAKRPMAPAIVTSRAEPTAKLETVSMKSDMPPTVLDAFRALKKAVIESTEDVGSSFADEARKMHFGDIEERHIRGTSTAEETRELIDDGVPFGILPPLPEDHN